MRYALFALFVFSIGAPVASALPTVGPSSILLTKSDVLVQEVKRSRTSSARQKRSKGKDDYGIHPLVGSGGY